MLRDEAVIEVIAGDGGAGLVSFRRDKYAPQGGPDGGDGGHGGDVVFLASGQLTSLLRIGRKYRFAARNGQPGGPRKRTGASADDRDENTTAPEITVVATKPSLLIAGYYSQRTVVPTVTYDFDQQWEVDVGGENFSGQSTLLHQGVSTDMGLDYTDGDGTEDTLMVVGEFFSHIGSSKKRLSRHFERIR